MSTAAGEIQKRGGTEDVPSLIREAGDAAARAYRDFLDDPVRTANTRKLYRLRAGRFFRWADARGLNLETIDAAALAAYAAEIALTKSQHEATTYLTPVRGLFRHLVDAGALAENPCARTQHSGRQRVDPGVPKPSLRLSELQALRMKAMAELDDRYGDDLTFGLVKSIDRYLAAMASKQGDAATADPGPQEAPDER